jgi:translation initiation factor 1
MSKGRIVWSDEEGDLRKKNNIVKSEEVNESDIILHLRRLTTGKGRTVIEISNLPNNKSWCKKLAKDCKKTIGVGGAYKNDMIEIHGEKIDDVMNLLKKRGISYRKTGG